MHLRIGHWDIRTHCSWNYLWMGLAYDPGRKRIVIGLPMVNVIVELVKPWYLLTPEVDRLTGEMPFASPKPDKTGAHALFKPPKMSMFGIMKFREEHVTTYCCECFFKYCGEHWAPIVREQCLPCLMKDHAMNGGPNGKPKEEKEKKDMGTNYYARLPDGRRLHIGKLSAKCRFLFRGHDGADSPTSTPIKSVDDWKGILAREDIGIFCREDELVSPESFWTMVEETKDFKYSLPQEIWGSMEWLDEKGWLFSKMRFS